MIRLRQWGQALLCLKETLERAETSFKENYALLKKLAEM